MISENLLAIVIPAYKSTFLNDTLDSISNQTNKNFTLYIGDDCSPYDIESIVNKYKDKINIVYKRFETNLGGKDLVSHWERCIDMTQGEEWIWLFSDDDIMGHLCVEKFYNALERTTHNSFFHFDIKIIDDDGVITKVPNKYPDGLTSYNFYKGKMQGKYMSLVIENIFSREIYLRYNKFQKFDLAWGSDTATWIKFSEDEGFNSVSGEYVYWRCGTLNISPDMSKQTATRKIIALVSFFNWTFDYFSSKGIDCLLTNIRAFVSRAVLFKSIINADLLNKCVKEFCEGHNCKYLYYPILLIIKIK